VPTVRIVSARVLIVPEHCPTLHSEPVVEQMSLVSVPRELSLPYQQRLRRSPPSRNNS
jgi:hypothetical protein